MAIRIIKQKIEDLEKLADEVENLGIKIIENNPLVYKPSPAGVLTTFGDYEWNTPSESVKKDQRIALRSYQKWYSTSSQLIKEYLNEREEEFRDYYQQIIEYLQFDRYEYSSDKNGIINGFIDDLDRQRGILSSVSDTIEIKEMNLRKLISADFVETELDEAEVLFNHKYKRCAGALAGVALEKHLEIMCQINNLPYNSKDTINPLVTNLYKNNILDITELKKVEHLASIRNKCDHPNSITEKEVKELIDSVKQFVNTH